MTALGLLAAMLLDLAWGEPRHAHPLVLFGRFAAFLERVGYGDSHYKGVMAWCAAVLPWTALACAVSYISVRISPWASFAFNALALYLAVGYRSLGEHARPVARALREHDLPAARRAVSRMVSRDTAALDGERIAAAATESVLENGADAVFGALFWFAVFGAPGAVLYRLANTLDAMWGYRTLHYERFGWAAARIDDVLNFIPARLTAATYALCGDAACAWRCWRGQARNWDSPNAGPVMAAGAGALRVRLGGPAPYHGTMEERPLLGEGEAPSAATIDTALALVRRAVVLWLSVALLWALASAGGRHV